MNTTNKRRSLRLDCSFPVELVHPLFGRLQLVARNLSAGGIFLETCEPLPLGMNVEVHFGEESHRIIAQAEVRNHYFLNFADQTGPRALAGMGLRFVDFATEGRGSNRLVH